MLHGSTAVRHADYVFSPAVYHSYHAASEPPDGGLYARLFVLLVVPGSQRFRLVLPVHSASPSPGNLQTKREVCHERSSQTSARGFRAVKNAPEEAKALLYSLRSSHQGRRALWDRRAFFRLKICKKKEEEELVSTLSPVNHKGLHQG